MAVFDEGQKYSWSVKLFGHGESFGTIGVVDVSSKRWDQVGGYEWWDDEGVVRHRFETHRYGKRHVWRHNDIITIHIDFSDLTLASSGRGTISFSRNGINYGIAFDTVKPPVNPAISSRSYSYSWEIVGITSY